LAGHDSALIRRARAISVTGLMTRNYDVNRGRPQIPEYRKSAWYVAVAEYTGTK